MARTGTRMSLARGLAFALLALTLGSAPKPAAAASHREAPRISLDPPADITDFFLFRSYEAGRQDKVILIMNVFPGGEPSSGPNYFTFDPNVLYAFHVDNDRDGKAEEPNSSRAPAVLLPLPRGCSSRTRQVTQRVPFRDGTRRVNGVAADCTSVCRRDAVALI